MQAFEQCLCSEANNIRWHLRSGGFNTQKVKLGAAITNIYLRHPNLLANEVAALHQFTGGRFSWARHRSSRGQCAIGYMGRPPMQ